MVYYPGPFWILKINMFLTCLFKKLFEGKPVYLLFFNHLLIFPRFLLYLDKVCTKQANKKQPVKTFCLIKGAGSNGKTSI